MSLPRPLPRTSLLLLRSFHPTPPTLKKAPPLPPRPSVPEDSFTEVYLCGSGPGGQKINKTASAVQLKHIPTGLVIKSQATRSREQNRKIARRILAEKVEVLENGLEGSRKGMVTERKQKKKKSAEKKSKRKYRVLEAGAEGEDGEDGEEGDAREGEKTVEKKVRKRRPHEEKKRDGKDVRGIGEGKGMVNEDGWRGEYDLGDLELDASQESIGTLRRPADPVGAALEEAELEGAASGEEKQERQLYDGSPPPVNSDGGYTDEQWEIIRDIEADVRGFEPGSVDHIDPKDFLTNPLFRYPPQLENDHDEDVDLASEESMSAHLAREAAEEADTLDEKNEGAKSKEDTPVEGSGKPGKQNAKGTKSKEDTPVDGSGKPGKQNAKGSRSGGGGGKKGKGKKREPFEGEFTQDEWEQIRDVEAVTRGYDYPVDHIDPKEFVYNEYYKYPNEADRDRYDGRIGIRLPFGFWR